MISGSFVLGFFCGLAFTVIMIFVLLIADAYVEMKIEEAVN